jgi:hypothetical protein
MSLRWMKSNKLRQYLTGAGFTVLFIVILYLTEALGLIPLIIVLIVLYGLFPFLLGALTGFFMKKFSALAGALAAMAFLLVWMTASPTLWISRGEYILNRLNIRHDSQDILRLILFSIWYGVCGWIGGEIGAKLRRRIGQAQKKDN